jgi:hypothetical protein
MLRRSILSATERDDLLAIPTAGDELIRLYTLNDTDLALIRRHRVTQNRLGFAVLLCYMRCPRLPCCAWCPAKSKCRSKPGPTMGNANSSP